MIVYIPVGNGPLRREYISLGAGMIVQRQHFRFPKLDCPWIMDNGAYGDFKKGLKLGRKVEFDEVQFVRCVDKVMKVNPCQRPLWCLTPDIVADKASLGFSVGWRKDLPNALKWYLAIQDGMEFAHVENALATAKFSGLFIGGTVPWKRRASASWIEFGHSLNLPVHIGRINGYMLTQWAMTIEADSIDGTGWTRDPRWVSILREMPKKEERDLFGAIKDSEGDSRAAPRRKTHAG